MTTIFNQRLVNARQFNEFFASELFHDVQMAGIFDDSKTFADARPTRSFEKIATAYQQQKDNADFSLERFVKQQFILPQHDEVISNLPQTNVLEHIQALWPLLCKQPKGDIGDSLLPLSHPYIVPGGRFREIYYWDSYFTALGLIESGRIDIAQAMLDNFIELITHYHIIPNGNRSYYLSRSQPPILALFVDLLLPHAADKTAFLSRCVAAIKKEHEFWMRGQSELSSENNAIARVIRMPNGSVLNRYWDDNATPRPESYKEDIEAAENANDKDSFYRHLRAACESGWDFSSRWLTDPDDLSSIVTCDIVPVDLNCLLYQQEMLLAKCCQQLGDESAAHYHELAQQRKQAIDNYLWSAQDNFYMDYNIQQSKTTSVKSLAATLPLYVGIASDSQASSIANSLKTEFIAAGGLVTTTTSSEQQWDNPNGWAPLQWFATQGLINYHNTELAHNIMRRWIDTVEAYYHHSGKLMEKYNLRQQQAATGGEYDVQEGFGWTNAVCQMFYKSLSK